MALSHFSFAVGSLVRARDREWVVLPPPPDDDQVLLVRPLGGREEEVTGILPALESVTPATFALPDPSSSGDHHSCSLLRDAVRLGFRNSAGPFRSFARIAVDPRPYQLVPLLMALRLDPVRLLIADDVGIGKTIEAGLVARELLDRGEIRRLAVLCPPQLADQWQEELDAKFHIGARLVLPGTVTGLERECLRGESVFDRNPFVVVSMDFIKSDRRRNEFLRACPEFVIVDEAHTCADSGEGRGSRHQRHELVRSLSERKDRHLVLVTATPHSGNEGAFRSLRSLLSPDFASLPENLSGPENERHRRALARHMVQRRRADLQGYLGHTTFPERDEVEETYHLSSPYAALFEKVLNYAREQVLDETGGKHRQRVRWWSVLALLRALASSPAAAAATLRARAAVADTVTPEDADIIGRRTVLDQADEDTLESMDVAPGSDAEEEARDETRNRRRLRAMASEAEKLSGAHDAKLERALQVVEGMLKDGLRPIVFCRFIATAEYVADHLRRHLERRKQKAQVEMITGLQPPEERKDRVLKLDPALPPVLVCTDCLSEGINLQDHFDAVLHYDLSWNPTRHEQREGRVDRFGQRRPKVRMVTYYGVDNQVDGLVLDVLIRKHRAIRKALGVSVPVPADTDDVLQALMEGLVLRRGRSQLAQATQLTLPFALEDLQPRVEEFNRRWDNSADREKRSRTLFAQHSIKVEEVQRELDDVRTALGCSADVRRFVAAALPALGGAVTDGGQSGALRISLNGTPHALRDLIDPELARGFAARFEMPVEEGQIYLERTHPFVEGLATYLMDTALDPVSEGKARRCGVIRTRDVATRTTLSLVRCRYHIVTRQGDQDVPLLAEDCQVLAFAGAPDQARWLDDGEAEALLSVRPSANVSPPEAQHHLRLVLAGIGPVLAQVEQVARQRGQALLEAHRRVRSAAGESVANCRVEPQLPPDLLGVYVYLPG